MARKNREWYPRDNLKEASLVKGINIFGFENLTEVISFLEGTDPNTPLDDTNVDQQVIQIPYLLDFQDVYGQDRYQCKIFIQL